MKKISNVLKALFALAAITVLGSCSNDLTKVNDSNISDKPVIRINFSEDARTVLPDIKISELTDITLTDTTDSSNPNELGSWTSFSKAESSVIELDSTDTGRTLDFKLTAMCGAVKYYGTDRITISNGENELKFFLIPETLGTGTGKLSYSFSFADAENADTVSCVCVKLNALSGSSYPWEYFYKKDNAINNYSIKYEKDNLSAGNYEILIYIYKGSVQLLKWRENIQIAEGKTSTASKSVDALNSVFTVKKYRNYSSEDTTCYLQEVSRFSSSLDNPSDRSAFNFGGWYTDKDCTDGNKLEPPITITSDISVYAKWIPIKNTDGSYNITSSNISEVLEEIAAATEKTSATAPVVFRLSGNLSSSSLATIRNNLKLYNSKSEDPIYYTLDFSGVTSSYYLTSFTACDTLTSITLNSSVYSITPTDFKDCTALKQIIIPSENTSLVTGKDGAVYSKDGKTLYVYPQAKTTATFTIPAEVTTIQNPAFAGADISAFAVADGNTVYKAIDDVLFSADERELIVYPASKAATSYSIPEKTNCLHKYAFAGNKNLTELTIADTNCVLKYSTSYYSDVWNNKSRMTTLSSTEENVLSAINTYPEYYYYNTSFNCYVYDAEEVTVFDKVSRTINNNSYVITDFSSTQKYKWYKFTTEKDKEYKIFWYDYRGNNPNYSVDTSVGSMTDCIIYVYSETGTQLKYQDETYDLSVTADSDITYIKVSPYNDSATSGKCAFRVMESDASTESVVSAIVEVLQDDIKVTTSNYSSYLEFTYSGDYVARQWYVDGNKVGTYNYYDFYFSSYTKGIHLVTLEVKKTDGKIYSYSAQIKVQ